MNWPAIHKGYAHAAHFLKVQPLFLTNFAFWDLDVAFIGQVIPNNHFPDRRTIFLRKYWNFKIEYFECQLHGKHGLGDKRQIHNFHGLEPLYSRLNNATLDLREPQDF